MRKLFIAVVFFMALSMVLSVSIDAQSDPSWFKFKITDKAYIDGQGILEYGLFNVPMNRNSDFDLFMTFLLFPVLEDSGLKELGGRYLIDWDSMVWLDDNPNLSLNVKRIMYKHDCNASVTRIPKTGGTITFIFNFHTDEDKWELLAFQAYKR
jgi:hypothetical protein